MGIIKMLLLTILSAEKKERGKRLALYLLPTSHLCSFSFFFPHFLLYCLHGNNRKKAKTPLSRAASNDLFYECICAPHLFFCYGLKHTLLHISLVYFYIGCSHSTAKTKEGATSLSLSRILICILNKSHFEFSFYYSDKPDH